MMHPHLLYAQAIKGRFTGRGIGVIDAIQLMEVVQGLSVCRIQKLCIKQYWQALKNGLIGFFNGLPHINMVKMK
jgi:hypothetical protein